MEAIEQLLIQYYAEITIILLDEISMGMQKLQMKMWCKLNMNMYLCHDCIDHFLHYFRPKSMMICYTFAKICTGA